MSFRLENPIHAPQISIFFEDFPNFSFWGVYPRNFVTHHLYPQKALSCAERRVLSPYWSRSNAQCDLWTWQRKQKKERKKNWQTGYSLRPPTSPDRSQSLHAGWPPVCSSTYPYQVLLKSVQWFCCCGWSKIALSHYFSRWLIQQLVLPFYRTLLKSGTAAAVLSVPMAPPWGLATISLRIVKSWSSPLLSSFRSKIVQSKRVPKLAVWAKRSKYQIVL